MTFTHHFSSEVVKKNLEKGDTDCFEGGADLCLNLFFKLLNILDTTLKSSNFKALESAGGGFRVAPY